MASSFTFHSRQLQSRLVRPIRNASTSPPKPRLLDKPERFNPPSHGSRPKAKPRTYGAPLSEPERDAQRTKQYPHMMPPEGSFMYWFLTTRNVHTFISVGVLVSLVAGIWVQEFLSNTPYKDMLPPNSMFFAHPWRFLRQYWEVYNMHLAHRSQEVAEHRKRNVDDVAKRSAYRKAHGLESGDRAGLFGGWTAKSDQELLGPAIKTADQDDNSPVAEEHDVIIDPSTVLNSRDSEPRKKVFGLW